MVRRAIRVHLDEELHVAVEGDGEEGRGADDVVDLRYEVLLLHPHYLHSGAAGVDLYVAHLAAHLEELGEGGDLGVLDLALHHPRAYGHEAGETRRLQPALLQGHEAPEREEQVCLHVHGGAGAAEHEYWVELVEAARVDYDRHFLRLYFTHLSSLPYRVRVDAVPLLYREEGVSAVSGPALEVPLRARVGCLDPECLPRLHLLDGLCGLHYGHGAPEPLGVQLTVDGHLASG